MKILVAVDGSPLSQAAAHQVVRQIGWYATQPEVHLLHVRPPIPYPRAIAEVGRAAVAAYEREESEMALAAAEKLFLEAGVPYRSAWCVGNVVEELGGYARKHGIDLLVMGSHGQSAFANLALGSVATKCIATLDLPILIVPRSSQAAAGVHAQRLKEEVG